MTKIAVPPDIIFRPARPADSPAIAEILRMAVERMLAEGKRQWDKNYPTESHVLDDIRRGAGYVLESGGKVIAYGAIFFDGEPAYKGLQGDWLTDEERYVVVHRLAVDRSAGPKGLGGLFLESAADLARAEGIKSFRIDTNFDNFAMLRLLDKSGFTYCGEITYENGRRMAFEKHL